MKHIILTISILLFATTFAAAQCCTGYRLEQALPNADLAVIGKVLAIKSTPYQQHTIFRYTVEKSIVYKGDTAIRITNVYDMAKHAISKYRKGNTYLFIADERTNNEMQQLDVPQQFLRLHPCSGSATDSIISSIRDIAPILKRF